MKFFKRIIPIVIISLIINSCNFLDVSDELAGGLTSTEEVFETAANTREWYANAMSGVPDYSMVLKKPWEGGMTGLHNPWTSMTDEVALNGGETTRYFSTLRNASNMLFHRWGQLYGLIRQCNIFLEQAHPIGQQGTDADFLGKEEFSQMKANIIFMRAYYHYLLMEQYGPIIIMDQSYGLQDDPKLIRDPINEVVKFIDKELTRVLDKLPQNPIEDKNRRALPTKGVALAVKAKLWMYAASPLFNGGYDEALSLKNAEGENLFPPKDNSKWEKALQATRTFIEYAEGRYELYKVYTNGKLDPKRSVYELFQHYNNEVIWSTPANGWRGIKWGDRFDRRATPSSEPNGLGTISVVQELVDDFYMKDGRPISDTEFLEASPLYSESGFTEIDGVQIYNMWVNRGARFYNTVFYAGRRWHISNNPTYFHQGTPNGLDTGNPGARSVTGYLLYKRMNRTIHMNSPGTPKVSRPSYVFRLAEFYLLYAEALNEVNPSHPDVLEYVNKVRRRAGLPDLQSLNPAIKGNQELQRQAIRREMRVELATEGQRYFNVRRWMIADNKPGKGGQGGWFTGMNMEAGEQDFYERTRARQRMYDKKYLLYPIPLEVIQKNPSITQNPGW